MTMTTFFTDEVKIQYMLELSKRKCQSCLSKDVFISYFDEEKQQAEIECRECGTCHTLFQDEFGFTFSSVMLYFR